MPNVPLLHTAALVHRFGKISQILRTLSAAAFSLAFLCTPPALAQEPPPIERIHSIHTIPPIVAEGQGFDLVVAGNGAWTAEGAEIEIDEATKTITVAPTALFCGTAIGELDVPNHESISLPPLESGVYSVNLDLGVPWGCRSVPFQGEVEVVSFDQFDAISNTRSPPNRSPELVATHESPAEGQVVSGVSLLRGWACYDSGLTWPSVGKVTFSINGAAPVRAVYGSSRLDTQEICGVQSVASGYGFVMNWNLLGVGSHTIEVFVDDVLVEEVTFSVAGFNQAFIKGLSAEYTLEDFPSEGGTTTIQWSESDQGFTILDYLE